MKAKATLLLVLLLCINSHGQGVKKIFLKLDDVAVNGSSSPGLPTVQYLVNKKIKASYGFIANRNDETTLSVFAPFLNAKDDNGELLIEVWNHGYDHTRPEFEGTGYDYQKKHFEDANTILNDLFRIKLKTFAASFNGTDEDTNTVVSENDNYKVTYFQSPAPDKATTGILTLQNRVDIEETTGNPVYTFFITDYNYHKDNYTDFMVLQGHPNSWDENDLNEFKKIVDFLISEGWEFELPYDHYVDQNTAISPPSTEQTITFSEISKKQVDDADFDPGATSTSNLDVFYNSSNLRVAQIVKGKIQIKGPGTAVITASQIGNAVYKRADYISRTLTVEGSTGGIVVSTLPVYENFDYAVGQQLIRENETIGLGLWSTTDPRTNYCDILITESPNWSLPNIQTPTGKAIEFKGGGIKAELLFTPQTGNFGKIYTSILIKVKDASDIDTSAKQLYGFGTENSGGSISGATFVFIKSDGNGGYNLGVNESNSSTGIVWDDTAFTENQELMIVLYFDDGTLGTTTAKMWINPTLGGTEPTPTTVDTEIRSLDVDRVQVYQHSNANTPGIILDELRIGKTWESVTSQESLGVNIFDVNNFKFVNPVKDILSLETKDISILSLKIYNLLGKEVLSKNINKDSKVNLNASNLKKGIYLFSVETENGTYRSKFLKE